MARHRCASRMQMATAKPTIPMPLRRRWRRTAAALAVVAIVLFALAWKPLRLDAVKDASYAARVGCACRFVAGRELSACRKDFEDEIGAVMLSENAEARSVTARTLLSAQTATYREGPGCRLERWKD